MASAPSAPAAAASVAVKTPKYMPPSTSTGSVRAQNERRSAARISAPDARGSVRTRCFGEARGGHRSRSRRSPPASAPARRRRRTARRSRCRRRRRRGSSARTAESGCRACRRRRRRRRPTRGCSRSGSSAEWRPNRWSARWRRSTRRWRRTPCRRRPWPRRCPPGMWRSRVLAAPKRSSTTLPRIMKCAISVNSGMATSR